MSGPTTKANKVAYVGSDTGFFQNISQRFTQTYSNMNWEFEIVNFQPDLGESAQTSYLKLISEEFCIIYLDFSSHLSSMLYLAELCGRDPHFKNVPLVGFVESKNSTRDCLGAGADFIYVKGGEFHDLVYAPMCMAFPKKVITPKFAKAKLAQETQIVDDFRVSYVAPTYLHVEGNFFLEEGVTVSFETGLPVQNVPSKNFIVKNRAESNLYYDFNYSYDLDLVFVDEPEIAENEQEDALGVTDQDERVKAIKKAREARRESLANHTDSIKRAQKKHKSWVIDQMDRSKEKKTKVLIVDQSMRIFSIKENGESEALRLDKQPYSFRCQTEFGSDFSQLKKMRPAIISYQMMGEYKEEDEELFQKALKFSKEEASLSELSEDVKEQKVIEEMASNISEREKEEMSFLSRLIKTVKEIDNYGPIITLFRCYFQTSKSLQESFQYPMLVTHSKNLSLDVILDLAGIYEKRQSDKLELLIKEKVQLLRKKDPQKYRKLNEGDFKEKKYFIRKKNPLSYGSINLPITVVNLTESDVIFNSSIVLPMKTYRMSFPLEMSIHLVPIEEGKDYLDSKSEKTYRGIIHSISETDKKSLRKVVNEVFFEPLKEQRLKEKSEFDELNKKMGDEIKERKKNLENTREERARNELGLTEEESQAILNGDASSDESDSSSTEE